MATSQWAVGTMNCKTSFNLGSCCVAMVEGSLVDCQLFPLLKDSLSLIHDCIISHQMFQILHFLVRNPLNCGLKYGIFLWEATQSVTCRFTHVWTALAWIVVSQTCLCISSSASATTASWVSTLPIVPMVTQSRMDFMVSASSFEVTWLSASAAALSHPFWYSMLKVYLASDFTQWCWVTSKLVCSHDVGEWVVVGFDNEQFPE